MKMGILRTEDALCRSVNSSQNVVCVRKITDDWKGLVIKMFRTKGYIFTNKKHSGKGIMSTCFGLIGICSNAYGLYESYQSNGLVPVGFGAALFLTMCLTLVGLILGILGKTEQDRFYLFAYLGIFLNVISLFVTSFILYAG